MRIKKIQIKNFRSIQFLDLIISDFTVLIGANNSGKSNILRALLFFFQGSEKISQEDVFSFFDGNDAEVYVIVTFEKLNEQEKTTFDKYVLSDGTVVIRRICQVKRTGEKKIECSNSVYNGWIEEPDKWFLQENAFERLSSREKREEEAAASPDLEPLLEIEGRFSREILVDFQKKYVSEHRSEIKFSGKFEENPLFGRQNVASGILPEIIFVPAIRDLSDETKVNSKTLLGKLLLNVLDVMVGSDADFQKLISDVEASIEKLNDKRTVESPIGKLEKELSEELTGWGVNSLIRISPPDIAKLFELGTNLLIDDGVETEAEYKGNGLQRAIIFGLFKIMTKHAKSSGDEVSARSSCISRIYAIEEAELYLHPHKQREFYANLKSISEDENSQVIFTTHSSHFVRMDDYKSLTLIRKPSKENGTIKNQCCEDIFDPDTEEKKHYKLLHYINPDNGDMFFARKVILVEGESEKVVLPYLSERIGFYKPDVSIINCGSKFNLPFYANLLNHFEIPYIAIFDEDPMKPSYDDPKKEKADRRTYELNKEIVKTIDHRLGEPIMIPGDFESHFLISKNQGEKLGKGLAALKHYQEIENESIQSEMIELITKIYS